MEFFIQQPDGSRILSWKPIALIGASLGAAALLVIVLMLFLRGRDTGFTRQEWARVEEQLAGAIASCATAADPEACKTERITDAASRLGSVRVCAQLEGTAYDDCAWQVARDQEDPKVCESIANETQRVSCLDSTYRRHALAKNDVEACGKLSETESQENCRDTVMRSLAVSGTCSDAAACAGLDALRRAMASGDPGQCDGLEAGLQDECRDMMGPGDRDRDGVNATLEARYGSSDTAVDTDGDGLTDVQEIREQGTDPANPDTDGDTFPDGQEVSAGYNPLGAG